MLFMLTYKTQMALNDALRTQALVDMIAWVDTFEDPAWFDYSTRPGQGTFQGNVHTVVNGTTLRYAKALQTTSTMRYQSTRTFICYSAYFTFPAHTGAKDWAAHVWVYNPQPNIEVNKRAALDGLKQFLYEQSTHQRELYADQYL